MSTTNQHSQKIVSALESGGRLLEFIEKSETKRVSKKQVTKFLQKKGVAVDKINAAYDKYHKQHNLFEILLENNHPLRRGYGLISDAKGHNAVISWVEERHLIQNGMKRGSIMYDINGKRVDNKPHTVIINILKKQTCPFYIIFQGNNSNQPSNNKPHTLPLHPFSRIKSITRAQSKHDIDWQKIGEILLDYRFLPNACLINYALDHLETFCVDEDVNENEWRTEICKAWSASDDRGTLLWQILSRTLGCSEHERRWFYDLILHFYFTLSDMSTTNIACLITKILRDLGDDVYHSVDLVKLKEILAVHKVDGSSFNTKLKTARRFTDLFKAMKNVSDDIWVSVYCELKQWKSDEKIRSEHKKHQQKYKNKVQDVLFPHHFIDKGRSNYDVTRFKDITRVSIRNDVACGDSQEKEEWELYRHNVKNIFIAFAGYNASKMTQKEFRTFISMFDIGHFGTMHLMKQDVITMDEFIKYLCSEYVNNAARDMKQHIERLPQWTLFKNGLKFLDEIEHSVQESDGVLQYKDFQIFAINLDLNDLETEVLFDKIDSDNDGVIYIDDVFKWLKKKLLNKLSIKYKAKINDGDIHKNYNENKHENEDENKYENENENHNRNKLYVNQNDNIQKQIAHNCANNPMQNKLVYALQHLINVDDLNKTPNQRRTDNENKVEEDDDHKETERNHKIMSGKNKTDDENEIDRFIYFLMNDVQYCDDAQLDDVLRSFSENTVQKALDGIHQLKVQHSRITKMRQKAKKRSKSKGKKKHRTKALEERLLSLRVTHLERTCVDILDKAVSVEANSICSNSRAYDSSSSKRCTMSYRSSSS